MAIPISFEKTINYLTQRNENDNTVILPGYFVYIESRFQPDPIPEAVIFTSTLNRNRNTSPITIVNGPVTRKKIWGCCDGLVCLYVDGDGGGDDHGRVMLWNPTINCYKTLPHTPPPNRLSKYQTGGIGYDASNHDYKILLACSKPLVFSVKYNSWKQIEPFPYNTMDMTSVFVNGCIHMVVIDHDSKRKVIVSFDVVTEKFKELALPSSVVLDTTRDTTDVQIFIIKGLLGFAISEQKKWHDYQESKVDLWVMKDYGFEDSWIKFATLSSPKRMYRPCTRISPKSFDSTGEVHSKKESGCWFDIATYEHSDAIDKSFSNCNVIATSEMVVPYVESLLSPLHL